MKISYRNRYAGLTAEIVKHGKDNYGLTVTDADGAVEHESRHWSKNSAIRAMGRYWNGWEACEGEKSRAKSLRDQCIDAGALFFERRGGKVLERGWNGPHGGCDLVVLDGDTLVFAQVSYRAEGEEPEGAPVDAGAVRERMERIAVDYVSGHVFGDMTVRFDVLSMIVMQADRVFITHRLGAFSAGD